MNGNVAIVTGAAEGIGAAVVSLLRERGANVVGVDLEDSKDADVSICADVSRSAECKEAVERAATELGRVDMLFNCAGIQRYGTVIDTDESEWDSVISINLKSIFLMSKYAMPHLIASGRGAVVNIASVQAFATQHGVAAYSASKGGIVALTKAMAVDHAPTVRANCICPGSVDTPMLRAAAEKFGGGDPENALRVWGAMHPLERIAQPREIAAAAVFLASDEASFITGSSLIVDGGLLSIISGT